MNILLLEDNTTDADLTSRGLISSIPDCSVVVAQTLKQAREKLKSIVPFDIALLDMKLPDGNGLDLLMEIRQSASDIPVVILTGSGNEEVATSALKAGADDYIIKNQDYITKLSGVIESAIRSHEHNMLLMSEIIEVLYIEHHNADIDLTLRHLHQYAPKIRITTKSSAEAALEILPPKDTEPCKYNVIVLDYRLPGMNALEFTKILRQERKLQIPIILVTGQGNENVAIQALKLGVNEYLVKRGTYLYRLPSIILNVHQYQELTKHQRALAESESKYRLLAENSADVIFTLDLDLNYTYVSPSVYKLRGFRPEEVISKNILTSLSLSSYQKAVQIIKSKIDEIESSTLAQDETINLELELIKKDESSVWAEIKATILLNENKKPKSILGVTRDISQKKLYEEELFHSREEYKLFFDYDLTGDYLATTDGQLLNCNPAFIQILGLKSKEEALKLNLNKFYKKPEDRNTIIQELRTNGSLFNHEYELIRQDGKAIFVIANIIGIFNEQNELVSNRGYIFDNTERKLAKEAVQIERKMLRTLIDNLPDPIYVKDAEGRKLIANPADLRNIGAKNETEVLGKTDLELFSDEIGARGYEEDKIILETGNPLINKEEKYSDSKGVETWLLTSKIPILDEQKKITGLVGIGHDISDRKKAEVDLKAALEKAQESDRLKSAFLANMSHEIRTPMNGILGFAELLRMPGLTGDQQKEYIEIIQKSGDRMLNIINDIVDISKIESGLIEIVRKQSNINEQIEFVHTFFKPQAEEKDIILTYKNGLDFNEALIITDKEKVYAILNNLVKNAIKYTDRGSIEFGYVPNGSSYPPSELKFYVKDTGIGIPNDRKQAIFDRFIQADIADTRAFQGAGLGLSIAKAYVEMLGGTIWVESDEGKGTSFYFTLPYFAPPIEKAEKAPVAPVNVENRLIKGLKILIVEDDEISEMLLSIALNRNENEILKVWSGYSAVDTCRETPDIDLILMDIKMPGIDGYEATRQIRKFNTDVVIIAQTAFGQTGDREKAIESGCNDYISKPLDIRLLTSIIYKYVKKL